MKVDLLKLLQNKEAVLAERCKRKFSVFFETFWSEIEPGALEMNWHITFLCDFLQEVAERWERKEKQDDVLINIVFGLSKSTILQLYEAWLTIRTPSIKILGTSYSSTIATKNAGKVSQCLHGQKLQRFYPKRVVFNKKNDNKTQFENLAQGIYYTSSTGGTATGLHSDFIINDDPLNAKEANSRVKLEGATDYLSATLSSRKTQEYTVTITVMQRLHVDDPSGYLLAKKPLQHVCLPAYVDDTNRHLVKPQSVLEYYDANDGYLNPKRFGPSKIAEYKLELGPYNFAAQVQQNPADTSNGIFKKEWFRTITTEQFQLLTKGKDVVWNFDADTALTDKKKNDPTALLASCYVDNVLYIRNSYADWLAYESLLAFIPEYVKENGYSTASRVYVEPKANGISIADSLTKVAGLNAVEAPPPSKDKTERAYDVVPFCAANRVVFIDGSWNQVFLSELLTFPNAAHDDRVDTLTQAILRIMMQQMKPKRQTVVY